MEWRKSAYDKWGFLLDSDVVPDIFDESKLHKCPSWKDPKTCTCVHCTEARKVAYSKRLLAEEEAINFGYGKYRQRSGATFGSMSAPEPPAPPKETSKEKYERQRKERYEESERVWAQVQADEAERRAKKQVPTYGNDPDFIKGYVKHSENKDLSGILSITPQGQTLLSVASGLDGMKAAFTEFSETGSVVGAVQMAGRAALESYAERKIKIPKRPSWRQSEMDVTAPLENQGFRTQVSFKDGAEVPYGTKGSTRPEAYKNGLSIEVKNYNVETAQGRSNLVRNVSKQAKHRAKNLPVGTKQQVNIDVRGQNVSRAELNKIVNRVVDKSDGALKAENINILR